MPSLKNYHILISHSWKYSTHYDTVCTWFDEAAYFYWSNYSVCCDNPIDTKTDKELKEKLTNKISNCSCIVVLSGMYAKYSKWIDFEIDKALEMGKPIIGVKPWGQERIPTKISENCDTLVGWNSASVTKAVRDYSL